MSEWRVTTLDEICDVNPEQRDRTYEHKEIQYIDISSVGSGELSSPPQSMPLSEAPSRAQRIVKRGDILISTVRPNRRSFVMLRDVHDNTIASTGFAVLRAKKGSDANFIYALVREQSFTDYLVSRAEGSAYPAVNASVFKQAEVMVPSSDEQKEIGLILSSLDDKIDLLKQQNETLEAMARAIFKSWFVDFDPVRDKAEGRIPEGMDAATAALFSSTFTVSPLGPIPEGWNTLPVIDWASYVNGAAYKDMHFSDDPEALPVIKIAELKYGISPQTKYTATQLGEQYRIESGDMLFSWSGSPDTSIDTFLWAGGDGWLNQHIFKVIPREQHERTFLYSMLKYLKPVFIEIARDKQTSGLGHVTRKDLQRLHFVEPPEPLIKALDRAVGPIVEKYEANLQTVQTLSELRDTLLPRLISGKLRLTDAQALTEDAA